MAACLCDTAQKLLLTWILLHVAVFLVVVRVAVLPCCSRCGLALVGPGPRLVLLLLVACRVVPPSLGQARCPRLDPGASFKLFVSGAMFTVRLLVTFLMRVVTKVCVVLGDVFDTSKGFWAGLIDA